MLKGVLDKPLLVKILPAMVYGLRYFTMAVEDGPCGWGNDDLVKSRRRFLIGYYHDGIDRLIALFTKIGKQAEDSFRITAVQRNQFRRIAPRMAFAPEFGDLEAVLSVFTGKCLAFTDKPERLFLIDMPRILLSV